MEQEKDIVERLRADEALSGEDEIALMEEAADLIMKLRNDIDFWQKAAQLLPSVLGQKRGTNEDPAWQALEREYGIREE